jgi:phosphate starvation-inducible PhoH-like protein
MFVFNRFLIGTMFLLPSVIKSFVPPSYRMIIRQNTLFMKKQSFSFKQHISPKYKPKTENQKKYVDLLHNKSLVVVLGPAGSGKTLLACVTAIEMFKKGDIQKIILTRPMVTVENEEVGFLPGNLVAKMDPWTKPMFDIFSEYYTMPDIIGMIHSGKIEICPLAYMRGRTFHNSFIIADEMQNSSPTQLLMLSTRLGENSKMVIMGDLQQSDSKSKINGLSDFLDKYDKRVESEIYGIGLVKLETQDVLRSEIVRQILKIYHKIEENNTFNSDCALIPKDQYNPL